MFEKFSISGINALPRFGNSNNDNIDLSTLKPFSKSVAIYIHIPYCKSICHFCMLRRGSKAVNKVPDYYVEHLIADLELHHQSFKDSSINTIYFGGGTPSMLSSKQFEAILKAINENYNLLPNVEITFEGEPQTLNNEQLLESLQANKVSRISFGLQTFDSSLRNLLGRTDTIEDIVELFSKFKKYRFKEINIDYLYNLPNTNIEFIEQELALIQNLNPTSIDCHPLKYISCSGFMLQNIVDKNLAIPNAMLRIEMFNCIRNFLLGNGFKEQFVDQYSIYDKSETNQYMRNLYGLDGGEYLGIGPGSRSHFGDVGFTKTQNLDLYFSQISNAVFPIERITDASLIDNYITCFSKRNDKLFISDLKKSSECAYFITKLERLCFDGYLDLKDGYYSLNQSGLNWYQNIQEVLLSPNQKKKHLENVVLRKKKFAKYGTYFDNLGTTLC